VRGAGFILKFILLSLYIGNNNVLVKHITIHLFVNKTL